MTDKEKIEKALGRINRDLKPCPFCGEPAKLHGFDDTFFVKCTYCSCETVKCSDFDIGYVTYHDKNIISISAADAVVRLWNRRAE